MTSSEKRDRPYTISITGNGVARGTAYMIVAALILSLGATSARFAGSNLNVFTLVFWSNLCMFIFISAWVLFNPPAGGIRTKRLSQHFLRSVFTYAALVTYFYALARIPFANAVILQSMGPIFVPILALLIYRRLSDRYVWLGVLTSFVGVGLIVQPDRVGMSTGDVAGVLAALSGAAAALVIWSLSTTESPSRQMFYFSFFVLLLSAIPLPWTWQWPDMTQTIQIAFVAAFTLIGQYFYAKAFSYAPADKVVTWSYMSIAFVVIIGVVAWNEPILAITFGGAALIVGGAHLSTREHQAVSPSKQSAE